jgi:hypothetical protein
LRFPSSERWRQYPPRWASIQDRGGRLPASLAVSRHRGLSGVLTLIQSRDGPDRGVRTRGLDIKAGVAKLKADRAARAEAELVVDRWNRRLATPGHAVLLRPSGRTGCLAGCLLSGVRHQSGDRPANRRPAPLGLGGHAGAWSTVLLVPRHGADAEAARAVRPSASQSPGRRSMKTFGAG